MNTQYNFYTPVINQSVKFQTNYIAKITNCQECCSCTLNNTTRARDSIFVGGATKTPLLSIPLI